VIYLPNPVTAMPGEWVCVHDSRTRPCHIIHWWKTNSCSLPFLHAYSELRTDIAIFLVVAPPPPDIHNPNQHSGSPEIWRCESSPRHHNPDGSYDARTALELGNWYKLTGTWVGDC
jgi:hypothetical protein